MCYFSQGLRCETYPQREIAVRENILPINDERTLEGKNEQNKKKAMNGYIIHSKQII
jgi:hypothetical protein